MKSGLLPLNRITGLHVVAMFVLFGTAIPIAALYADDAAYGRSPEESIAFTGLTASYPGSSDGEPGQNIVTQAASGSSVRIWMTQKPVLPTFSPGIAESNAPQASYCTDLLRNGGFEAGNLMYWSTYGAPSVISTGGHSGWHSALLGGRVVANDRISQSIACPFTGNQVEIGSYLYIHTNDPIGTTTGWMKVRFWDSRGNSGTTWYYPSEVPLDTWMGPMIGSMRGPDACAPGVTWNIEYEAVTDTSNPAFFLIDDVFATPCCFDDTREPNNNFAAASAVNPGSYDVRLCPSGDEDWFRFGATAGQGVVLRLRIAEAGQATVCLVSPTGEVVGCDSGSYPNTSTLTRIAQTSGSWRVRVHDPGYQTFGKLLQLTIEVVDMPTATPTLTPTDTPTNTPTRIPTYTPTRTPTRTPETIPSKLYLPLLIQPHTLHTAMPD